ncbi:PfkB family carbohydrate kinase [Mariniblastus fucicola]|nr:PfkB family carbohydrate kinase [Mariniblastus fucicola]
MSSNLNPGPVAVIGEVLFDHFSDGNRIVGGAPFNVAWNIAALGLRPVFISGIGDDAEASEVIKAMQRWDLATHGVQIHPALPTGRVDVSFADDGEPSYEIASDQAWDVLNFDRFKAAYDQPPGSIDIVYHGSLAFRSPVNRTFLKEFDQTVNGSRFVDLNVRDPWFDESLMPEIVGGAKWLKLSKAELERISGQSIDANSLQSVRDAVDHFIAAADYDAPLVYLVTFGKAGACWIGEEGDFFQTVTPTDDFVDSVGAGDAFTSAAIDGVARNLSPQQILAHAVEFASRACTIRGATTFDRDHYKAFSSTSL